jgi:uncharacterized repeat protein (TIGR01451 family)
LGGFGGDGVNGGSGGKGGSGTGGGLDVAAGSGILTLSIDTLNGNTARGGLGGLGTTGGSGGKGGDGTGGGMDVAAGGVTLSSATCNSNNAHGGNGGNGGTGGAGGNATGGGLYVAAGSVTLGNDILDSNHAHSGNGGNGGSLGPGSPVGGNGGGGGNGTGGCLYAAAGNVTLTNDTLNGNTAQGGSGGNGLFNSFGGNGKGGSLYAAASNLILTLTNDTLSGNIAHGGVGGTGGVGFGNGGNGGRGDGGGLYVVASSGTLTLTNDTFSGNKAQGSNGNNTSGSGGNGGGARGGGLDVATGSGILALTTNDTFSGNTAQGGTGGNGGGGSGGFIGSGGAGGSGTGGGLYVPASSSIVLANTLIAENHVAAGAGGSGLVPGSAGNATGPDFAGTAGSSDHDLIGDPSGSFGFGNPGSGDLLNVNPNLGPLQNNGGPTQTLALLAGSPAINAGDSHAPGLLATDQRGFARIVGNAVDIGAYEFGATPATTDLSVSGLAPAGIPAGGQITYRLTVTNNSSTAQSNVTLADGLPANTTLVSWTPAAGWSSSAPAAGSGSGTVTAWIGSLAANSSANFTLIVQINSDTANGTVIRDTASVGPITGDPNPANNSVTFNTTVGVPVNVSADVAVQRSGFRYDFALQEFVQTVTITNISGSTLFGPLALQLINLSGNATLANATGSNNGIPYLDFVSPGGKLAACQSITVTLFFKDPTKQGITYGTQVWQGF